MDNQAPPPWPQAPKATQIAPIRELVSQQQAVALLQQGDVIAAPTDTVYGVMCRYDHAIAIEQLYIVKDRPPQKAIPILIADPEQLGVLVEGALSTAAQRLAEQFWPGPLTLILPARPSLLDVLTAGQPTVAVRIPDHEALRALIRAVLPLATTSANRSGWPDTITAAEVMAQLGGRIPLILADDEAEDLRKSRVPSTIVDVTVDPPAILRPGPIEPAVRATLRRFLPARESERASNHSTSRCRTNAHPRRVFEAPDRATNSRCT